MKNSEHVYEVHLDLQRSTLSDKDLCSTIKHSEALPVVALDLTLTRFSGAALDELTINLQQVEKLDLRCCSSLTDTGLHQLLTTSGSVLKDLVLTGTCISDAALVGVHLPKLENLDLSYCCNLTDTTNGLQELLNTSGPTLKRLDLGGTNVSDAALEGVQLPQLEKLCLYSCRNITDAGVQGLLSDRRSHLKLLVLADTKISDAALLGLQLPILEALNLSNCKNLSDAGVHQLLTAQGSALKDLALVSTNVSDALLEGVRLPRLEKVNLSLCQHITNTGVKDLLTNNRATLRELILNKTGVSGALLADWMEHQGPGGGLRTLSLARCQNVSDIDLARMRSLLPDCNVEK